MVDRFFIPAAVLAAFTLGAALAGCTTGSSDEYRTFDEVEAENQAQPVSSTDDDSATLDENSVVVENADSASDDDATESIERAVLDGIPASDSSGDELLALAVIREEKTSKPGADAREPQIPATPAAPTDGAADAVIADPASKNAAIAAEAGSLTDLSAAPREIKLLVPEKSFHTEGPQGALRVSYDDLNLLTILNMEPVPPNPEPHFPDWLNALEGRRIHIRGFMYPAFLETGLRGFILVRDNQECCFGPGAKIYDHIEVFMRDGVTTDYIQGRPFDVVGVLHIRPEADDDELYQLYQIEDAIVIDH